MADADDATAELSPAEDIRAALNAAFQTRETSASEKPATGSTAEPSVEKAEAPERARGPDGKFIRAEESDAAAEEPEKIDDKAKVESEKTAAPEAEKAPAAKEPPANWAEADKTAFKALPPQAQDFLLKRHADMTADYTRKTQELAADRREFEPIKQMFAPYQDRMRQMGLTIAQAVGAWANVEQQLMTRGPAAVQAIAGIVRNYGLPADQIAAAIGVRAPQPVADGALPPVEPPAGQSIQLPPEIIQQLTAQGQWIAQEQQRQHLAAQQQYAQAGQRVQTEIEQFASATDSAGAPLHPHFAAVEDDMTRLALAAQTRGGPVPPLSELYETAVWANPSTRAQLIADQRAAEEAQHAAAEERRKAEARAKAEQSRRAGASVSGAPGNNQAQARPRSSGSVRDDLLAAAEELADA